MMISTIREQTIRKIEQLPESLVKEVNDYIEFLFVKQDHTRWQLWTDFSESFALSEAEMSDYLDNLMMYEDMLARGEIQW